MQITDVINVPRGKPLNNREIIGYKYIIRVEVFYRF